MLTELELLFTNDRSWSNPFQVLNESSCIASDKHSHEWNATHSQQQFCSTSPLFQSYTSTHWHQLCGTNCQLNCKPDISRQCFKSRLRIRLLSVCLLTTDASRAS